MDTVLASNSRSDFVVMVLLRVEKEKDEATAHV